VRDFSSASGSHDGACVVSRTNAHVEPVAPTGVLSSPNHIEDQIVSKSVYDPSPAPAVFGLRDPGPRFRPDVASRSALHTSVRGGIGTPAKSSPTTPLGSHQPRTRLSGSGGTQPSSPPVHTSGPLVSLERPEVVHWEDESLRRCVPGERLGVEQETHRGMFDFSTIVSATPQRITRATHVTSDSCEPQYRLSRSHSCGELRRNIAEMTGCAYTPEDFMNHKVKPANNSLSNMVDFLKHRVGEQGQQIIKLRAELRKRACASIIN